MAEDSISQDAMRLRALATAEPLHRIRALSVGGPLDWLDYRDIAMHALGCLLETWGLGGSDEYLDKELLSRRLAERVLEQASHGGFPADRRAAREYGSKVIDTLLNSREKGGEFTTRIYDREARSFASYSFRLVEEAESEDNRFYLQPSAEASNLYFQSFVVDVQDELIGQRHALEHHIRNGRTDRLAAIAEQHRRSAVQLLSQVRALGRRAERSIRAIIPDKDVVPLLANVRKMAAEEASFDRDISLRLSEQLDIADDAALVHINRTIEAIKNARNAFLSAKSEASGMLAKLEKAAIDAACRASRHSVAVPDIETEIVLPFIALPVGTQAVDELITAFLGACLPEGMAVDPVHLAEQCVPLPVRAPTALVAEDAPDDYVVPPALCLPRFGEKAQVCEEAIQFMQEHGAKAGSLGTMLSHTEVRRRGDAFAEALAIVACAAFKDQGGRKSQESVSIAGLRLRSAGYPLKDHPALSGSDILMEAA